MELAEDWIDPEQNQFPGEIVSAPLQPAFSPPFQSKTIPGVADYETAVSRPGGEARTSPPAEKGRNTGYPDPINWYL
jgi:hypothetical protein